MKTVKKFYFWKKVKIAKHEFGFHFVENEFKNVLKPGTYWFFDPKDKHQVDLSPQLTPRVHNIKLEEIIFSGKLKGLAEVIDLKDACDPSVFTSLSDGLFRRFRAGLLYSGGCRFAS